MPKYGGNSTKRNDRNSRTVYATTQEEAKRKKAAFFWAECDRGHHGKILTNSRRCLTCQKLGRYE